MENERRQTLLKKVYHENCPGCKVDQLKETEHGFPIKHFLSIWVIMLCSSLPISALFPFLYFMIRDLHVAETEEDIGFYAGFVGASYMLGRALTSVFWGIMSDRYGRKPIIIIGTSAVVIFNTLFGLSVNYWMAIVTRVLLGSLSGLFGPTKAYASEIFRKEHQALGLSTISTAWGIGLILGPSLGGFLAQPAEKYPHIFSTDSVFGRFPYFLPCMCISVFALVVTTVACFWLPETLHFHGHYDEYGSDSCAVLEAAPPEPEVFPKTSLITNWPLMSSIVAYSVVCLHDIAYTEIFSLWTESPRRNGGLSYSTDNVGVVLAISGFALMAFQLSVYPFLNSKLGPIMLSRIAGVISIPLLACHPYMTLLSGFTLSLLLNCASALRNIITVTIITGMFLLQNDAVDQNQRGAANGLSITAMSLFKAAGPAAGGAIFSWAQKRQDAFFLPGDHMVFFILNLIGLLGVLMTFKPFLVERVSNKQCDNEASIKMESD